MLVPEPEVAETVLPELSVLEGVVPDVVLPEPLVVVELPLVLLELVVAVGGICVVSVLVGLVGLAELPLAAIVTPLMSPQETYVPMAAADLWILMA